MKAKRLYNYLQGIKGIALILYLQFVISADIMLRVENERIRPFLYVAVFLVLLIVCPAIMKVVSRISIRFKPVLTDRRRKCIWFSLFMLISVVVFGIYYIAYNPGGFTADSMTQYKQVLTGEYNNWHPVLHTLLFFKLPLLISGGNIGFLAIFQLSLFSIAAAYAAYTILRHSNAVYACLSLVYILINPVTCYISVHLWKDIAFAITALFAVAYSANIYFTKGIWLKKKLNIAAVIIVLVLATVFRHNALLFTVPLLIALFLYLNRKAAVITGVCFIAAVVLIEGPLYALLNVEKPGDRQEEMLGVPMSVIGEVAARNPAALDNDIKDFLYEVAPAQTWTNQYVIGNFNTVKFYPGTNYHRIEEEGAFKVVGYMLRCFIKSPKEAFRAFVASTDMVYTISGDASGWNNVRPIIVGNEYGIVYKGSQDVLAATEYVNTRLTQFLGWIYWYLGAVNLILIVTIFSKLRFRRKSDWKRILPAISLLLYNFGTMLLLSGAETRIFFFAFPITPVLLLIVMREEKDQSSEEYYILESQSISENN